MNEYEFIKTLQKRAKEQKHALNAMPLPQFYLTVIGWLGNHPWRFLIPLAFVISLLLRFLFGVSYTDFVLWIFRRI